MRVIDTQAFYYIKARRHLLTEQEFKTLRGLVLAGDGQGAIKGFKTIIAKKKRSAAQCKELQKI